MAGNRRPDAAIEDAVASWRANCSASAGATARGAALMRERGASRSCWPWARSARCRRPAAETRGSFTRSRRRARHGPTTARNGAANWLRGPGTEMAAIVPESPFVPFASATPALDDLDVLPARQPADPHFAWRSEVSTAMSSAALDACAVRRGDTLLINAGPAGPAGLGPPAAQPARWATSNH